MPSPVRAESYLGTRRCWVGVESYRCSSGSESPTRTFQQVVFGRLLTSKRLFIDTSWRVLLDDLMIHYFMVLHWTMIQGEDRHFALQAMNFGLILRRSLAVGWGLSQINLQKCLQHLVGLCGLFWPPPHGFWSAPNGSPCVVEDRVL